MSGIIYVRKSTMCVWGLEFQSNVWLVKENHLLPVESLLLVIYIYI